MERPLPRLHQAIIDLAPTVTGRAKLLKVHPRMIAWYLNGTHSPTIDTLQKAGIPELVGALILDLHDIHTQMCEPVDIGA